MTVYVETGCGYSAKVLKALEDLHIPAKIKNIKDVRILHELVTLGGSNQVPYMVDEKEGVALYDSDTIVGYLKNTYGPKLQS